MSRCVPLLVFLAAGIMSAVATDTSGAEAADPAAGKFTSAEEAYIALAEEFRSELEKFWVEVGKLSAAEKLDRKKIEEFYAQHDPAIQYLPKLLDFEREHAGEDVGLDALSEAVSYAARGGDQDSPGFKARRELLARLAIYEDRDQATMVIRRLASGRYDPQVMDYLRRVANSQRGTPVVRAAAQLQWAEELLERRAARQSIENRINNIKSGMPPRFPEELDYVVEYLATLPTADELDDSADKAIAMLEKLAAGDKSLRQPAFRALDPNWQLIRVDAEKTKVATPYSDLAAAVLFKEQHLRVGQHAPEVEVELLDGQPWRLADQRGRVTVIQFSFTGCGPCERMYPGMREMADEFGERLSLLTILRDETPDHGKEATKTGKITWPIACDGSPGDLCTRWAVRGFPDVYVIDRDGRIAAVDPRGEQLRWHVGRLAATNE